MAALAYTAEELAKALGVTDRHIRRMGRAGKIPMVELGSRLLFPKAAVHRWLEEQTALAAGVPSGGESPGPALVGSARGNHLEAAS